MFLDENDFFSVFGCFLENALENILQCCTKDKAEGATGEACVFWKWFTKKLDVNHFPNFNKRFFSQQKLFSVWSPFYNETNTCKSEIFSENHFTVKQTLTNLKIFSGKYFTAKQTKPKRKIFLLLSPIFWCLCDIKTRKIFFHSSSSGKERKGSKQRH